jgi:hypothetical protein
MSIHKLNAERAPQPPSALSVGLAFQHDTYNLADSVLKTRMVRALEASPATYAVHRMFRCAARRKVEDVFDDLALAMGMTASRLDEGSLLLEAPGVFIHAEGRRKAGYCSCWFAVWTTSRQRLEELREQVMRIVGERYEPEQMFTIDWHFMAKGVLTSTSFEELIGDTLHDEAYPTLGMQVNAFIHAYLSSPATVLILQGPPGTGKTRLVRAILGEMSKRREEEAKVMYTADKRALEGDEIFVDFITGSHDAFVIEDADHLLLARSSGNHDLHRFLAIADGVVRAQGRKIIFTTNLPNISDIDAALLRPGRCFASVAMRHLAMDESAALVRRLCPDLQRQGAIMDSVRASGAETMSVAQLYRMSL